MQHIKQHQIYELDKFTKITNLIEKQIYIYSEDIIDIYIEELYFLFFIENKKK